MVLIKIIYMSLLLILYHLNNNSIKLKEYYADVNTTNGTDYGSISFFEPNKEIKANIKYSESIVLDLYWKILDVYIKKYKIILLKL